MPSKLQFNKARHSRRRVSTKNAPSPLRGCKCIKCSVLLHKEGKTQKRLALFVMRPADSEPREYAEQILSKHRARKKLPKPTKCDARVLNAVGIRYPLPDNMFDRDLTQALYPSVSNTLTYQMPDYEQIHKEQQGKRITLNQLWLEYCEKCQKSGVLPYQLTQFKKYYRVLLSMYRFSDEGV